MVIVAISALLASYVKNFYQGVRPGHHWGWASQIIFHYFLCSAEPLMTSTRSYAPLDVNNQRNTHFSFVAQWYEAKPYLNDNDFFFLLSGFDSCVGKSENRINTKRRNGIVEKYLSNGCVVITMILLRMINDDDEGLTLAQDKTAEISCFLSHILPEASADCWGNV